MNGIVREWRPVTTTSPRPPGATGRLTFLEPLSFLQAPELAAPEIDGDVDAVYADAAVATTGRTVEGSGDGASAEVRTLWQGNTLYALFDVTDPVYDLSGSDPWQQDSVELFLDLENNKAGTYGPNDTQIRISAENVVSFGSGKRSPIIGTVMVFQVSPGANVSVPFVAG